MRTHMNDTMGKDKSYIQVATTIHLFLVSEEMPFIISSKAGRTQPTTTPTTHLHHTFLVCTLVFVCFGFALILYVRKAISKQLKH